MCSNFNPDVLQSLLDFVGWARVLNKNLWKLSGGSITCNDVCVWGAWGKGNTKTLWRLKV